MGILYFDCFAGISGDMTLGALVDLGVDSAMIESGLRTLPIPDFSITWDKVVKKGISATFANISIPHEHKHRNLPLISEMIEQSALDQQAKELAVNIFTKLAKAEALVHGTTVDKVHFHEVGALDSILDIVGSSIAIASLGNCTIISSPVRTGFGEIKIAHGIYPIPAPGTAALLKDIPMFSGSEPGEFTTPTGAAILATICDEFGQMPGMKIDHIGYGAGSRDHDNLPNVLRIISGESATETGSTILVIECQMDDINPQLFGYLHDLLPEHGALDWFTTPIQMKKNRPGTLLSVLCPIDKKNDIAELLFAQTSTIGIRYYHVEREELSRSFETISTEYGNVSMKIAKRAGSVVNVASEYDDCRKIADQTGVPLKEIQAAAIAAWYANKKN